MGMVQSGWYKVDGWMGGGTEELGWDGMRMGWNGDGVG